MKIFFDFIFSLVSGVAFGFLGLIVGITIGGNFGFPEFGGNAGGYESGGVFFAIVGFSFGSLLGTIIIKQIQKHKCNYPLTIIATVAIICIGVVVFDRDIPPLIAYLMLLIPPITLTAITNQPTQKTKSQP